jgi:glycine dehydrogenase subunit 1
VAQPNYLGVLEDLSEARRVADAHGALLVVAFDPVAAGLLRTPGSLGADVVVGEGQPLGTPLSLGGPYLGLFATTAALVRRLPGRLVGETLDADGTRAYVTTLRTRGAGHPPGEGELQRLHQPDADRRRRRAADGVARHHRPARARGALRPGHPLHPGVPPRHRRRGAPLERRHAAGVRRPVAVDPATVIDRMADEGFLAGITLGDEYGGGLLVAATERRTRAEIDAYAAALEKVVR